MTKITLALDTRKASYLKTSDTYPIVLRVFHKKKRLIRLPYHTSKAGWQASEGRLLKSAKSNRDQPCNKINLQLHKKLHQAREAFSELLQEMRPFDVDELVHYINIKLSGASKELYENMAKNSLSLKSWLAIQIKRKNELNKPLSARWYEEGVVALLQFLQKEDIPMAQLKVSDLNGFLHHQQAKGNSQNTVSNYLRAVRALYNSAMKEDRLFMVKYPFHHFKVPSTTRTRKRAITKEEMLRLRDLKYDEGTAIWHARNYALIMFYCRGMNFMDLVQLKISNLRSGRIYYGRSKTGSLLSVKITTELQVILNYYTSGKVKDAYLFPANYDGTTKHMEKYRTLRRRMNERLAIMGKDAGIQEKLTTYTIRHTWATTAKYLGIPIEVISESLGHHSLDTTEVYLKGFNDAVLDEANEKIIRSDST